VAEYTPQVCQYNSNTHLEVLGPFSTNFLRCLCDSGPVIMVVLKLQWIKNRLSFCPLGLWKPAWAKYCRILCSGMWRRVVCRSFRRNIQSPSLGSKSKNTFFLLFILFGSEDVGGIILRNIGKLLSYCGIFPRSKNYGPEKQPLLANGSERTFVSRPQLGKHVPATTDTYATIEVLSETLFSTWSVQRGCKEDSWGNQVSCALECVRKRDSWKGAVI
jgi:hypothetical protein